MCIRDSPGGAGTAVSFGKGTGGGTGCPAFKRGGKDDHNGGAEICAERRRGAAALSLIHILAERRSSIVMRKHL